MLKHVTFSLTTLCALSCLFAEEETPVQESIPFIAPPALVKSIPDAPFKPFTGKIKGKKVRLRAQPDLEGAVIKELSKNDLLSILGEQNEFWAVEPPSDTKAYVFRSYILDNVVEGNRVNVRLKPDLESPVIGHLNAGDHIEGVISALNNKWYEISPPANARFYIAKDFVENIGGPEVKSQIDKRKQAVEQLMEAAMLLSKAELRKPFEEIDLDRLTRSFKTITTDYHDFPEQVELAKDSLIHLNETYLQKKIAYLEDRALGDKEETFEVVATADSGQPFLEEEVAVTPPDSPTERMKMWAPIEEGLYLTWQRVNDDRSIEDFYAEQKLTAVALTGILEPYTSPVKNKPGDFILRDQDHQVAYLYSTQYNLQPYVGKKVTITGTPRGNNHFAFPAYYVLSVE